MAIVQAETLSGLRVYRMIHWGFRDGVRTWHETEGAAANIDRARAVVGADGLDDARMAQHDAAPGAHFDQNRVGIRQPG